MLDTFRSTRQILSAMLFHLEDTNSLVMDASVANTLWISESLAALSAVVVTLIDS